eukprot:158246-Amphidinium_carterae.1
MSYTAVGLYAETLTLPWIVAAFAGMSAQITACALLTDAVTAERLKSAKQYGPEMMSFVSAGITVGDLAATATV